ncbi:hypothetical protein ACFE04_026136 [Oxalis oulophora]
MTPGYLRVERIYDPWLWISRMNVPFSDSLASMNFTGGRAKLLCLDTEAGSSTDLVVHVSDDNYFSEPICPLESVSPSEHIAGEPQPLSISIPEEGLKIGWTVETSASVSSLPPEGKVEEASNAPENEEPSKRWKIYDNYLSEPICPLEKFSPPEKIVEEPQALRISAPDEILKIGWTGASESSLPPKGKLKEASSVPENEEPSNRKKVDDNYLLEPICPSKSVSPPEQIAGEPQAVSISVPEEIPKIGWTGTSESSLPPKDKLEESSSVPEKEESSNRKKVDDNYLSKSNCLSESVSPPEQIAREPQALSIFAPEEIPKIGRHMETGASESSLPPKVKVETLSIPENEEPSRRITDEEISFDCIPGDTLKDAIVDIKVLINRVKFAKHLLESCMHPDSARPSWKYVEKHGMLKKLNTDDIVEKSNESLESNWSIYKPFEQNRLRTTNFAVMIRFDPPITMDEEQQYPLDSDSYKLLSVIGKGANATVYKVVYELMKL